MTKNKNSSLAKIVPLDSQIIGILICPKCNAEDTLIKHGFRHDKRRKIKWQIFKCKACGYTYDEGNRTRDKEKMKEWAEFAYSHGLSMRKIAIALDVSPNTISVWSKTFSNKIVASHAIKARTITKEDEELLTSGGGNFPLLGYPNL